MAPDNTIRKFAEVLPSLHAPALALIRRRRSTPVTVYLELFHDAPILDLRSAAALQFRTRFNGFYGVRRNQAWRDTFYGEFEEMKGRGGDAAGLFKDHLHALHAVTGRVEASFISKAVATLHPDSPVIDKVLRDRFASVGPTPAFGAGLDEALTYYGWLAAVMSGLASTPQGRAWCAAFDAAFSDIAGAGTIHPVKKIDFLIWGGRP